MADMECSGILTSIQSVGHGYVDRWHVGIFKINSNNDMKPFCQITSHVEISSSKGF